MSGVAFTSLRGTTELWRAELVRGLRRLRAGDLGHAERHFVHAHRCAPERPEVCFALGQERLRRGLAAEAEPLLRAAWDGDKTLVAAACALARCLAKGDQLDEAHAILDEASEKNGPVIAIEVVRGEMFLDDGRPAEARAAALAALALADGDGASTGSRQTGRAASRALLSRVENQSGIDLAADGHMDAAVFAFKRATDLDPEWSGPVTNLGAALARMGRFSPARAAYERAIAIDPENPLPHLNLGLLLRDHGHLCAAARAFETALDLGPDPADAAAALSALATVDAEAARRRGKIGPPPNVS
ncbi:MAG TPA: tetratricopeptide repeat protein [Kofleriaceae bacterium]|nr:tetratricopeptide repeat protein [Kofleriaceae bacterium]